MIIRRRRFKHTDSLQERLIAFAKGLRVEASRLPPGAEKNDLLRRADKADTAADLDKWVNSPGLQPPK